MIIFKSQKLKETGATQTAANNNIQIVDGWSYTDENQQSYPVYTDGTKYFIQKDNSKIEVNKENCKQSSPKAQRTQAQNGVRNMQCANLLADGDVKNAVASMATPIKRIYVYGGKLMIEHRNETTQKVLESLSINCPDYLHKYTEEQIPYNKTDINDLFTPEIQKLLADNGKKVVLLSFDAKNKDFLFQTADRKPFFLSQLQQEDKARLEKQNAEQKAAEEQKSQQANANVNTAQKMSKNDVNTIANTVLNALNKKVNTVDNGGVKVTWELVPEGFDASTLKESQLKEGIVSNIKNRISANRQANMTNKSIPTTFALKATIVTNDGTELTKENGESTGKDGKKINIYDEVMKEIWGKASTILGNVIKIKSTDEEGNPYNTQALFKLQPNTNNGVFIYKTQMNIGTGKSPDIAVSPQTNQQNQQNQQNQNTDNQQTNPQQTSATQQASDTQAVKNGQNVNQTQIQNNNQQKSKNNVNNQNQKPKDQPFWWDQASARQQKKYIKNQIKASKPGSWTDALKSGFAHKPNVH